MTEIKEKEGSTDNNNTNLPAPLSNPKSPQHDTPATNVQKQEGEHQIQTVLIPEKTIIFKESRYEKPTFWIQTSLAVIGLLTLIGFVAFSIINHIDSANSLKSANNHFDSANADTKKSLALTEENFRIENRAWVGLVREPSGEMGDLRYGELSLHIQNFGKTPAESAYISINYFPSWKKVVLQRLAFEPPRTISPSQSIEFERVYNPPLDSIGQQIFNKNLIMYLHGFIAYKDIYGGKDTTEFLFYVDRGYKLVPVGGHNRME